MAPARAKLVSKAEAERAGLARAWFAQASVDPSQSEIVGAKLDGGALYTLTSAAVLQSFDAETGVLRWSARLGKPGLSTFGPDVHGDHVAIANGLTLYLLDTKSGKQLATHRLPGAVGGAPAVADKLVFVPLVSGRVEGFPIGESRIDWSYASSGRLFDTPAIAGNRVVWTTDRGTLFAAHADASGAAYKFDGAGRLLGPAAWLKMPPEAPADATPAPNAPPVSQKTRLFIPSNEGVVYALDAERGAMAWRASVGSSINFPAVAVAGRVYVGSEEPTLHAFDAATGEELWAVPGVDEFVAASAERVYAVGPSGELSVIDAASGAPVARWPSADHLTPVANHETDRLYFLSDAGLLQCFHELAADKPYRHSAEVKTAEPDETPEDGAEAAAETEAEESPDAFEGDPFAAPAADTAEAPAADEPPAPAAEDDPFAAEGDDAGDDDKGGEEAPSDAPAAEDDPFADF
ncbi:MAG: PQQ-binding-like beta-propeller repeat protein [Lacipirellulaceae bacterium]